MGKACPEHCDGAQERPDEGRGAPPRVFALGINDLIVCLGYKGYLVKEYFANHERLVNAWGESASWELDARSPLHEARYLKLDCAKARSRLGWQPRWDIDHTLASIVAWHRAFQRNENMNALCLRRIEDHSGSMRS